MVDDREGLFSFAVEPLSSLQSSDACLELHTHCHFSQPVSAASTSRLFLAVEAPGITPDTCKKPTSIANAASTVLRAVADKIWVPRAFTR